MISTNKIQIDVTPRQLIIYYFIRFLVYLTFVLLIGFIKSASVISMIFVYLIFILYFIIFNRADRIIIEVDIDEQEIKLRYRKLFFTRNLIIPRENLTIKVISKNTDYSIRFYDDRFITNPAYMDIMHTKNVVMNTCMSKDTIKKIENSLSLYGYTILYE